MRPQVLCFLKTYVQLVFVEFDVDFLVLLRPYDPRAVNLRHVDIISLKIFMRRKLFENLYEKKTYWLLVLLSMPCVLLRYVEGS